MTSACAMTSTRSTGRLPVPRLIGPFASRAAIDPGAFSFFSLLLLLRLVFCAAPVLPPASESVCLGPPSNLISIQISYSTGRVIPSFYVLGRRRFSNIFVDRRLVGPVPVPPIYETISSRRPLLEVVTL